MKVLGIHVGHDASCAVVENGKILAAIQQERLTRVKHDGTHCLSNRLPLNECLNAAGIRLDNIDLIVSSFQAASPGGIGFHNRIVSSDFHLFDPNDPRHFVLSHHLAHASCALGTSGFNDSAILVGDLGGSTTINGSDFFLAFTQWMDNLCKSDFIGSCRTECLSIYDVNAWRFELKAREFCQPHNSPDTFIHSVASLYDNVSQYIFSNGHAHGQLMALAAFSPGSTTPGVWLSADDIVTIKETGEVRFLNGWQTRVPESPTHYDCAVLARATQEAAERAILAYVQRAKQLTKKNRLALSGGIFLNILANSRIVRSNTFEQVFVPSAPHDAGIALGCAFYGERRIGPVRSTAITISSDRLGPCYSDDQVLKELRALESFLEWQDLDLEAIAQRLADGSIVAWFEGRSEFGPRALGSRSILGSSLIASIKTRMNAIKSRQPWRPVAPVIPLKDLETFFDGPSPSRYMNYSHSIRLEHIDRLPALAHPDCTSRVQTVDKDHSLVLLNLLEEFGKLTGFPILVNTSMNGHNQPMIERPCEAVRFFLLHPDIDFLVLNGFQIRRRREMDDTLYSKGMPNAVHLAEGAILTVTVVNGRTRTFITGKSGSHDISETLLPFIVGTGIPGSMSVMPQMNGEQLDEIIRLAQKGLVEAFSG